MHYSISMRVWHFSEIHKTPVEPYLKRWNVRHIHDDVLMDGYNVSTFLVNMHIMTIPKLTENGSDRMIYRMSIKILSSPNQFCEGNAETCHIIYLLLTIIYHKNHEYRFAPNGQAFCILLPFQKSKRAMRQNPMLSPTTMVKGIWAIRVALYCNDKTSKTQVVAISLYS